MAVPLAATVAHDKHDPLILSTGTETAPASQLPQDGTITIEEYMYWASITRREEDLLPKIKGPVAKLLGSSKSDGANHNTRSEATAAEMKDLKAAPPTAVAVSDGEYQQAQRAARTAGWAAVFLSHHYRCVGSVHCALGNGANGIRTRHLSVCGLRCSGRIHRLAGVSSGMINSFAADLLTTS
jgi:hypothetical protein